LRTAKKTNEGKKGGSQTFGEKGGKKTNKTIVKTRGGKESGNIVGTLTLEKGEQGVGANGEGREGVTANLRGGTDSRWGDQTHGDQTK